MPVRQNTYSEVSAAWTLGQITRDDDDIRTDSFRTDPAAASTLIGFAQGVKRKALKEESTVQRGVDAGGADRYGAGTFAGITIRDRTLDPERVSSLAGADPVTFGRGQMITVLSRGCVAVKAGAAVKPGNPVHYLPSDQKFYAAKAAGRIKLMDASYLSAAAADGLVELRLDGLRVANALNTDGP